MAVDINNFLEEIRKQLDEWEAEGVLEERLKEYGVIIINYSAPQKEEDDTT